MADQPELYAEGGRKDFTTHPAFHRVEILDADAGLVKIPEGVEKVAFVGFASSTRDKAPYEDPSWLIVGLNQLYRYIPRADCWFEIHTREMFTSDTVRDTDYVGWLRKSQVPVIMCERQDDIPMSVRFPLERAIALGGRDYFQSTIAYMVAWAMLTGFKELGIWGVDLVVGDEYFYQKCNLEWWLGIAEARGVTVTIPKESALLKQHHRYGYQREPSFGPFKESTFQKRLAKMAEERNRLLTSINGLEGMMAECEYWQSQLDLVRKGATVPD